MSVSHSNGVHTLKQVVCR